MDERGKQGISTLALVILLLLAVSTGVLAIPAVLLLIQLATGRYGRLCARSQAAADLTRSSRPSYPLMAPGSVDGRPSGRSPLVFGPCRTPLPFVPPMAASSCSAPCRLPLLG